MEHLIINTLLGLAIGLSLGFLGGGGSILTVPALVYIVGQNPHTAVTASLIIVGANAGLGSLFHRGQGSLNWQVALLFGGVGMVTAYFAAGLSASISSTVLLLLFALLMLVVGAYMIFGRKPQEEGQDPRGWAVIAVSGAGVGVLTGFLGVGGGFLIVPALVMLVGLPIRQAIGTSLIIIAMNSLAGVLGHLGATPLGFPGHHRLRGQRLRRGLYRGTPGACNPDRLPAHQLRRVRRHSWGRTARRQSGQTIVEGERPVRPAAAWL